MLYGEAGDDALFVYYGVGLLDGGANNDVCNGRHETVTLMLTMRTPDPVMQRVISQLEAGITELRRFNFRLSSTDGGPCRGRSRPSVLPQALDQQAWKRRAAYRQTSADGRHEPPSFADDIASFSAEFPNHTLLDEDALRWLGSLDGSP